MPLSEPLTYYCDSYRHLVCIPYSVLNLHRAARELGIARWWFHGGGKFKHYDIPKTRFEEIAAKCVRVRPRSIIRIIREGSP